MPDLRELPRRLSDILEPSVELDGEIAALHGRHGEGVVLGRGRLAYTASLDAALAFAEDATPGWILDHLGDDGSGMPGTLTRGGATCELGDGCREIQGQAFNRATAVVVAVVKVLAALEEEDRADA